MTARVRALFSLVFWLGVGVVSYVLGVHSALGQQTEDRVLSAAAFTTAPPPPLNLVSPVSIALVLAILGFVALASYGWRRALGVVLVAGISIVAARLLKLWFLPRPELLYEAPNTFPSGHMTTFVVLVAAMIWAVPTVARQWATYGGAVLLCIASWQLLEYGWHRPSDIYGAIALGVSAYALAAFIRPLTAGRQPRRAASWILFMSASVALLAALGILAYAAFADNSHMLLTAGQVGAFAAALLASRTFFNLANPR